MNFIFFISRLNDNPSMYIMWVTVVMFSICFHEAAHAYVALKQGDPTAADRGHLSLNPIKQMGLFSIVMLLIIGIAWGAVPVDPRRLRHKYSDALVSFSGPAANLLLFFTFCLLHTIFKNHFNVVTFNQMFFIGAVLNIFLFIFNMLPIPMLDGWKIFKFVIPGLEYVSEEVKNAMTFIIVVLFFMTPLINYFFTAGQAMSMLVINLFDLIF